MSQSLATIPLKTIKGEDSSLADYQGQVLLIVNVASKCGLTPQYEGLEAIHKKYRDQGFAVLGFPANDFAGQEPGTDEEIATFCTTNFGVEFPMFSKITVTGEGKHPLYAGLTAAKPDKQGDAESFREKLRGFGIAPSADPEVLWNFEKFLVARDGTVTARFAPDLAPDAPEIITAIETELAK